MTTEKKLPRKSPETLGVSSLGILGFLEGAEAASLELHRLMIVKSGHVVAEGWASPYASNYPHILYSLSKSFCSTAAGLAIAEGFFTLDDKVASFFPEELPSVVSPHLSAMKVRHLLSMCTGHIDEKYDPMEGEDGNRWIKGFLAKPPEKEPGTHFMYNSIATYIVSAIVQKTTGKTLMEFLQPRLFAPLGISSASWDSCPHGVNLGGWGMSATTEDIAKLGQLYLQKGIWEGVRVLPEGWTGEATRFHISNGDNPESDWAQGYGFQFWRSRHGAYRGDGAFGQYCIVMEAQEAVVAITSNVGDMQATLNLVWEHLIPALNSGKITTDDSSGRLASEIASMAITPPETYPTSDASKRVSGKTYRFAPDEKNNAHKIETMRIDFGGGESVLTIRDSDGDCTLVCGNGDWAKSETTFRSAFKNRTPQPLKVSAFGVWTSENVFTIKLCYLEALFSPVLTLHFEENRLVFNVKGNLGFLSSDSAYAAGELAL